MAEQARRQQTSPRQPLRLVTAAVSLPEITGWDEFEQFVLKFMDQDDRQWELFDGAVREKPGMASEHNDVMVYLGLELGRQLDRQEYRLRINSGHIQRSEKSYFIPDLYVVPTSAFLQRLGHPERLEMYHEPLFLVAEFWSRSTGNYDITTKIPEYQARGDLEIWRVHTYDRKLTAWRRLPDGSYDESTYHGGIVRPAFLPNVEIDLDALFDFV